jgi:hypothetical protein
MPSLEREATKRLVAPLWLGSGKGDVSTFHFIDNLSRAIRHGGRILLDLIPKVYSTERIIRVLGEDMQPQNVQVAPTGQPPQPIPGPNGQPMGHVYDITAGKYDLTVAAGPSYTSQREEVVDVLSNLAGQLGPEVGMVLAPQIMKMMDMPGSQEMAEQLKLISPVYQMQQQQAQAQAQQGPMQQAQMQMQQMAQQGQQLVQKIQEISSENQMLKMQLANKSGEIQAKNDTNRIHAFEASTHRMEAMQPEVIRAPSSPPTQPGAA